MQYAGALCLFAGRSSPEGRRGMQLVAGTAGLISRGAAANKHASPPRRRLPPPRRTCAPGPADLPGFVLLPSHIPPPLPSVLPRDALPQSKTSSTYRFARHREQGHATLKCVLVPPSPAVAGAVVGVRCDLEPRLFGISTSQCKIRCHRRIQRYVYAVATSGSDFGSWVNNSHGRALGLRKERQHVPRRTLSARLWPNAAHTTAKRLPSSTSNTAPRKLRFFG